MQLRRLAPVLGLALLVSCGLPQGGVYVDQADYSSGGTSGDGDGDGDGDGLIPDAGADTMDGKLRFDVKPVSFGGAYHPRNVGAIWIETAAGEFVKTLAKWGDRRDGYIITWRKVSGGDTTDAMTAATLPTYFHLTVYWDLTDTSEQKVPDGDYRIRTEFTEYDGPGKVLTLPFSIGAGPVDEHPPDQTNFREIVLVLD